VSGLVGYCLCGFLSMDCLLELLGEEIFWVPACLSECMSERLFELIDYGFSFQVLQVSPFELFDFTCLQLNFFYS